MAYEEMLASLPDAMKQAGIGKGDMLYIASDASLLLLEARKKCGVKTVEQRNTFLHYFIDVLQEAVGTQGTLMFPVFTWAFCHGEGFDARRTLGEVGALNNWILEYRKDFCRTKHPLYSFMVWGKEANTLLSMENKCAWGENSPFSYLYHNNGKMLLLNVTLQRGFTFMHYVEESVHVPYRYYKNFRGTYKDLNGIETERSYIMYVRDLAISSKGYAPDSMLEDKGIVKIAKWGDLTMKGFSLVEAFSIVEDDLRNNAGRMCYKFANYELEWGKGATHADDLGN